MTQGGSHAEPEERDRYRRAQCDNGSLAELYSTPLKARKRQESHQGRDKVSASDERKTKTAEAEEELTLDLKSGP